MTNQEKNTLRTDQQRIIDLIRPHSRVLDLGCGNGELLCKLMHKKAVQGHGIEIDVDSIIECIEKGVPVIQMNLDEGLGDYSDHSFDYVILSHTLQVVKKPHLILREILRVGRTGIVSVPNFGYWKVRLQLLFKGKMPVTKTLPFDWYDTPNIHLLTIKDFKLFCKRENIDIMDQVNLGVNRGKMRIGNVFPNSFAESVVFTLGKKAGP
ncbi:methionine biosynthesis protein MetW [candidate division KSB1 bacterium]|nr:methionine biosynthesis protein MetW [candidate division KSB1 bacterium]